MLRSVPTSITDHLPAGRTSLTHRQRVRGGDVTVGHVAVHILRRRDALPSPLPPVQPVRARAAVRSDHRVPYRLGGRVRHTRACVHWRRTAEVSVMAQ